ncbi:MAG: hypothetical protein FJ083_09115 [Cyanobacteria bacterium K_Offshore_surface_m2_239]|nr:hypothetical protein [Cyanobacteria bacterium K_Offshore_surface_m2_239]
MLDTSPLVAWLERSDQDHQACAGFFQRHQGAFVSTWPVLTEVCHLIPPSSHTDNLEQAQAISHPFRAQQPP